MVSPIVNRLHCSLQENYNFKSDSKITPNIKPKLLRNGLKLLETGEYFIFVESKNCNFNIFMCSCGSNSVEL